MKQIIFLALIFYSISLYTYSQDRDILPYIEAWKVIDKTQSYKAQFFYDSLRIFKEDKQFTQRQLSHLKKLKDYIKRNPDTRLQVRLGMQEIIAAREFGDITKYYGTLDKLIEIAYPLQDEQLNADLYSLRADIPPEMSTFLLFNLKAVDIQRKIGFEHFPYAPNRLYGISHALYYQGEYKKAIQFGKECFSIWPLDSIHRDPAVYIFQCDILANAFKNLNQYDSAAIYYDKIARKLPTMKDKGPYFVEIWTAIAKGNKGILLTKKGSYKEAYPLLSEFLNISSLYQDSLNISMAYNALGNYYSHTRDEVKALDYAIRARDIANKNGYLDEEIRACQLISSCYKTMGQFEKSLLYYQQSKTLEESKRKEIQKSEYRHLIAQVEFDKAQDSLFLQESIITKERWVRNVLLVCFALLSIIGILVYNRKQLLQRNEINDVEFKKAMAEQKLEESRKRIATFTQYVEEKNNLIDSLQTQMESVLSNLQQDRSAEISKSLLQYTLLTEEEWRNFRAEFMMAYPDFFVALRKILPGVTPAMERLSALIFLGLDNNQIANSLGISKKSVTRSKHRLKNLLQLDSDENLESKILNLA